MWPKLDLQNLSLVSFVLFTAIRALSSQAVAAVVRLPNLPSLTCPYKAYKVTTTSFTALSIPPTAASATVLHHKFATQRPRLTVYTRGRKPLCGWRYCHQMGALCTVQPGALWEKILPSNVCTVSSGQDGGCSMEGGQMIVQAVHCWCFMGEDTAVAVTDLCLWLCLICSLNAAFSFFSPGSSF